MSNEKINVELTEFGIDKFFIKVNHEDKREVLNLIGLLIFHGISLNITFDDYDYILTPTDNISEARELILKVFHELKPKY